MKRIVTISSESGILGRLANILNVHPTTLKRWYKKGKLSAIHVGTRRGVGERRYHREDIIKLITK